MGANRFLYILGDLTIFLIHLLVSYAQLYLIQLFLKDELSLRIM